MHKHVLEALQHQDLLDLSHVDELEISIQSLESDAMRQLNNDYRGKDSHTNVLSFESGMPVLQDEARGCFLALGDIVFCPQVIADEAHAQGKDIHQHWAHLLIHGTLHLCGYDHIENAAASSMENLEIQVLANLGVPNPYQTRPYQ